MNWETLVCFGDSITFGARSYLGYPEICGDLLSKKLDKKWNVINHANNGFTTIDLVRSINPVFGEIKNSYPSLITVMIGTNDIKNRIPESDFIVAYQQLIIKLMLMSVNKNILLLKIPRLTKKVFYPYTISMNDQIDQFNKSIEKMASVNKLRVFSLELSDDDFYDGVHLSEKGVQTAAAQLSGFILQDKGL